MSTNGLPRTTRRREALLEVLRRAEAPMTAEEIYLACLHSTRLNLSTVYRALASLVESGAVYKTMHQDGHACYEAAGRMHSHHLVCCRCHRTLPIDSCPAGELAQQLSRETGFIITGHTLEFTGICPQCAAEK